ncbi:hypothetical protein NBO_38g0029 [Nosema bombycis CQ1]|uniref:Uncharacterized protein n=1 Tax=Nosema bombycis (strain CQ1 / CVCC 102059) TaxID=578461 RepID=R0MIU7_NOSB1|nr:hypothetical protein NBO_38g0029 [Nosema bombycis CQ1]|eukprot:EOB14120.1 hypothetical protein NBO_38g0029 [Nosema bombycis CQ1]
MQNLVPTQNEINEKIEDLLNNNPDLQSFLTQIKNSNYLIDDLTQFDSTLSSHFFNSHFSGDILEILCILVLKSINFNFEFLMHKKNIHEKQNVKIKSKKMKENIVMPNFKRMIREYLKSTDLKVDLKSIRIFIIYCILEEGKRLSLEDLCIKEEISVYGGEVSTNGSSSSNHEGLSNQEGLDRGILSPSSNQEGLSQSVLDQEMSSYNNLDTILNPSSSLDPFESISLDPINNHYPSIQDPITPTIHTPHSTNFTPYVYIGPFQIFYFIHYLISNDLFSLRDSLLKSKFLCDWSLLGLPQMNDFVLNELRFIKDISILSSIILQCKSHLILLRFLPKLLFKLKFTRSFHILVLSSFDPKKVQDTSLLLIELYKEDPHKTNKILRDLIVGFKPPSLTQIFFKYFKDLNLNYFECLKIYLKNLPLISNLKIILKSDILVFNRRNRRF